MNAPLLKITELSTWLDGNEEIVRAIEGLSIDIGRGETFALLGESGCGKSMTALSVMRLLPDTGEIVGGAVELDGVDLLAPLFVRDADHRHRLARQVDVRAPAG